MEKKGILKNNLNADNQFVVPPMLIRTLDAGGFFRANGSFLARVGFSEVELAEEPFLNWIDPKDVSVAIATIKGKQSCCLVAHRTKDGEHLPLQIRVVTNGSESLVLARSLEDTEEIHSPEDSEDEATVRGTLHTIARIVEDQNPGYKCSILLVTDGHFVRGAGPSLPEEYNAAIDGYAVGPTVGSCGTAIYWNVPVIVEDIQADPLWGPLAELAKKAGVAACWSYPFSSRTGNVLGALAFYSPVPRTPTAEQLGRLKAAARMAGLAVERGRAEEALLESKQKYQSMVDNIGIGVALISPNMEVIDLNKQMQQWLPEVVPGQGAICYRVFHDPPRDRICSYCPTCKTFQDGQVHESITETPTGGSIRNFRIVSSPILKKNGRVKAAIAMVEDITEKLQLEANQKQRQKMESIGVLAGGIAHEFNNILGIIIGNTELAIDDVPEWNSARDCLEEIRTASLRAKDVVRRIMSFARKTPVTRKPIRISTIVKDAIKLIRATIPTTIEMRQEFLCNSEMILGNPTEINQILMNLCTNAVHAMENETGLLEIGLESLILNENTATQYEGLTEGEYVKLTVKDTGEGIEPEITDRILEPYFTTKDVDKGLGMGLAVVYGIVKKHDGAISIKSEIGKGTLVEVLFPLTQTQAETEVEKSNNLSTGTESILFIDDEASLVKLNKQILEKQGYKVVGKTSSTDALKLFQDNPEQFDLVITDMAMPEMAGDYLSKELFKIRSDIPIILCTGHSDRIDEKRAKNMGISAYTVKPLVKKNLIKIVRKVLDESKYET